MLRKYQKESNIELIYLSSYSPNLILVERLWKFFKKSVNIMKDFWTLRTLYLFFLKIKLYIYKKN